MPTRRLAAGLVIVVSIILSAGPLAAEPKVGLATGMHKIMIRGQHEGFPFQGWTADRYELSLARNETEAFQVVIMPGQDLSGANVRVSEARAASGNARFNGKIDVWLVGHVDVSDQGLKDLNSDYPPHLSDYTGWYPDPLLTFQQSCDIKAGDRVSFWVNVVTRSDTPAGDYTATVTVSSDQTAAKTLQLELRVWDFELPEQSTLPTAFSCHDWQANIVYGREMKTEAFREKLWSLQAEHRLSPMELYRHAPVPLSWLRAWKDLGANAFNLGMVPLKNADDLDEVYTYFKEQGLLHQTYVYGFDEVKEEKFQEMHDVFTGIQKRYPGLRTMTTAGDDTFGRSEKTALLRSAVDIWVPTPQIYKQEEAEALRAEGKEMWWYVAVGPRHPYANFLMRYPAIEARLLLGAMTYKYKAGGFLYYSMLNWADPDNGLTNKPIASGPYTDWNPGSFFHPKQQRWADGDGCLYYAGPPGVWAMPCIRLANIRDGLEDYEYLHMLGQLVAGMDKGAQSAEHTAFMAEAKALLAVPDSVVTDVTHYTRDPLAFGEYRRQLAEKIVEGRKLAGSHRR